MTCRQNLVLGLFVALSLSPAAAKLTNAACAARASRRFDERRRSGNHAAARCHFGRRQTRNLEIQQFRRRHRHPLQKARCGRPECCRGASPSAM